MTKTEATLLDILHYIDQRVTAGETPGVGICDAIKSNMRKLGRSNEYDIADAFRKLAVPWPEFSGDIDYPVPWPVRNHISRVEAASFAFHFSGYRSHDLWFDTDYGKARVRLLRWCIKQLETLRNQSREGYLPS